MIQAIQMNKDSRIIQGDIISNVEYIESVKNIDGVLEISKIIFPMVLVLTQDCDLTWDYDNRQDLTKSNQDKYLFSVIVVPIYNYEHFIRGEHLSDLNQHMGTINSNPNKTENKNLKKNETPRYHYMEFTKDVPIVPSVIDFKHYFTVNIIELTEHKKNHYVCTLADLFRERVSQRFSNYLSRIGLPEPTTI